MIFKTTIAAAGLLASLFAGVTVGSNEPLESDSVTRTDAATTTDAQAPEPQPSSEPQRTTISVDAEASLR